MKGNLMGENFYNESYHYSMRPGSEDEIYLSCQDNLCPEWRNGSMQIENLGRDVSRAYCPACGYEEISDPLP